MPWKGLSWKRSPCRLTRRQQTPRAEDFELPRDLAKALERRPAMLAQAVSACLAVRGPQVCAVLFQLKAGRSQRARLQVRDSAWGSGHHVRPLTNPVVVHKRNSFLMNQKYSSTNAPLQCLVLSLPRLCTPEYIFVTRHGVPLF